MPPRSTRFIGDAILAFFAGPAGIQDTGDRIGKEERTNLPQQSPLAASLAAFSGAWAREYYIGGSMQKSTWRSSPTI
jgi:class 3 adenylate cyclase